MSDDAALTPPSEPAPLTPETVLAPTPEPQIESVSATPEVTPPVPPPSPQITNVASIPIVDAVARARAYASVVQKRERRFARIIEFVQKKGKIKNSDIVRLLHVSEATAGRYARMLVSRGLLKREGHGRSIVYQRAL